LAFLRIARARRPRTEKQRFYASRARRARAEIE
jgi:hypothetical protein